MKRIRNKKEGKFSIPAFIIPVLDYVYYRIWLWCQKHIKQEDVKLEFAVGALWLMIITPIIYTLVFFIDMFGIPRYKMLTYCFITMIPFFARYSYSKKYKSNNYQMFRDRWEHEPIEA